MVSFIVVVIAIVVIYKIYQHHKKVEKEKLRRLINKKWNADCRYVVFG